MSRHFLISALVSLDWVINDDGTIGAKHHPHLVLGVANPTMILTERGASNQCVFAEAAELRVGGTAKLTLKSHPGRGIGKKYLEERRAGPWRYIESDECSEQAAVSVKFEDGAFLKLASDDLVLDVAV